MLIHLNAAEMMHFAVARCRIHSRHPPMPRLTPTGAPTNPAQCVRSGNHGSARQEQGGAGVEVLARPGRTLSFRDPTFLRARSRWCVPRPPRLPCPALPCPALPCPALPCPALPHLTRRPRFLRQPGRPPAGRAPPLSLVRLEHLTPVCLLSPEACCQCGCGCSGARYFGRVGIGRPLEYFTREYDHTNSAHHLALGFASPADAKRFKELVWPQLLARTKSATAQVGGIQPMCKRTF